MSTGNGPARMAEPPPDLITPPGLAAGRSANAAPDSLVAKLQGIAERKREQAELTVELPGWEGALRVRYGTVTLDEIERFQTLTGSPVDQSLVMLARACRAIEVLDDDGAWKPIEDEIGPVTWDDRLARRLGWPRPDAQFRYQTRDVFKGVFDDNGFAISQHVAQVARWMGLTEEEVQKLVGEASPETKLRPSAPPPPSASTLSTMREPAPSNAPSSPPRSSMPPNTGSFSTGGSRG